MRSTKKPRRLTSRSSPASRIPNREDSGPTADGAAVIAAEPHLQWRCNLCKGFHSSSAQSEKSVQQIQWYVKHVVSKWHQMKGVNVRNLKLLIESSLNRWIGVFSVLLSAAPTTTRRCTMTHTHTLTQEIVFKVHLATVELGTKCKYLIHA